MALINCFFSATLEIHSEIPTWYVPPEADKHYPTRDRQEANHCQKT